jgi:predicted MFS family arabinose efflux permease
MMMMATGAFFACAFPLSFPWFFLWRFLSGLSGGMIMVLVAPTIMPHVPPARGGLVAGAIFVGVGIGIAASGTLVPAMLPWGLVRTWQGLGCLALILSVIAWNGWPEDGAKITPSPASDHRHTGEFRDPVLAALYFEYALDAAGIVTHVIFFVDFIARGLDRGLRTGAAYWVVFGLAAALGPLVTGNLADRIGFRRALRLGFLAQFAAVGILVLSTSPIALTISSVVVGAFVPGIVPLVFGRMQELTAGSMHRQKVAWGLCATAFALGQAGAAYGLSYIFARTGGAYIPLFAVGAGALLLAFVIDVIANALSARRGDFRAAPAPDEVA